MVSIYCASLVQISKYTTYNIISNSVSTCIPPHSYLTYSWKDRVFHLVICSAESGRRHHCVSRICLSQGCSQVSSSRLGWVLLRGTSRDGQWWQCVGPAQAQHGPSVSLISQWLCSIRCRSLLQGLHIKGRNLAAGLLFTGRPSYVKSMQVELVAVAGVSGGGDAVPMESLKD